MKTGQLVIVIADESLTLMYIKTTLEDEGFVVKTFQHFKIALEVYRDNYKEVKALILDLKLTGVDYSESFPALLEINKNVPIIALSDSMKKEELTQYYQGKIKGYLKIPYSKDQLLNTVKDVSGID